MAEVAVLGAGMMGSAICVPLCDRGHGVRLVGTHLDVAIIEELRGSGQHPGLKLPLPGSLRFFQIEELAHAMEGVDVLVLGVSSPGVEWAARTVAPFLDLDLPVLMVSKGLQWSDSDLRILPDIFAGLLPEPLCTTVRPVAVAGPCIAGELARRVETCVVFAGRQAEITGELADLASTGYYHVRTSSDLVGVELCAALKNAFAMAMGFAAGMHEKAGGVVGSNVAMHNCEAAVFAQAAAEMELLVRLAGGDPRSAYGLAGVGDLQVTYQGGRTARLGRWLGLGLSLDQAVRKMEGATLECLDVLRVLSRALPAFQWSDRIGPRDLPLTQKLCRVVVRREPALIPFDLFFRDEP